MGYPLIPYPRDTSRALEGEVHREPSWPFGDIDKASGGPPRGLGLKQFPWGVPGNELVIILFLSIIHPFTHPFISQIVIIGPCQVLGIEKPAE